MKREREFLKDLNEMPFVKHFQKDKQLRISLFNEYLKTDLKPCKVLYTNQYYTSKEIQNELIEANKNIDSSNIASFVKSTDFENELSIIRDEYYTLLKEENLNEKYYKHSIDETEIYKLLNDVYISIEDFKEKVLSKNSVDAIQYSNATITNIIYKLEEIGITELTRLILSDFVNDNENVSLLLAAMYDSNSNDIEKDYRELKRYADNKIKEYLAVKPKTKEEVLILPKGFNNFVVTDEAKKVLPKIYDAYKNVDGKHMAILLHVLFDENIIKYIKGDKRGRSRKDLAECFTPNINDSHVRNYFNSQYENKLHSKSTTETTHIVYDNEIEEIRKKIKNFHINNN